MPSLIAFGRRWNISSDDFVFPELTEAFVRLAWVVCVVVIFVLHEPFKCDSLEWLMYIIVMLAINLISAGFCLYLTVLSARGSILDMNARKGVVTVIYIRVPLVLAEILWTVTSTVLVFGQFDTPICVPMQGARIALLLEWILIFTVGFGVFLVFNPHGNRMERSIAMERVYWRRRFFLCKICQNDEMREALDDIAALIATFFVDNDFVWSDIVAGLLLLVHSPDNRQESPPIEMERLSSYPDWMEFPACLPVLCRMFDFAAAIYGWPAYLLNNVGCFSCCRLCRKMRRRCPKNGTVVIADNCCLCNTGAFLLESNFNETDLLMVNFRNRLFQVPFIVLTDHQTRSVVVALRGSASLFDLVTDMQLNDEAFSIDVDKDPVLREDAELENNGDVRVHRGMLRAARYVYDMIKKSSVIEEAFVLNPTYNLAVCGHSLGAGIATLLTLLLKQTYPNVRCFAFSPPGCVISECGIPETQLHVMSVIVGDDFIPQINIQSLQRLKQKIVYEIFSTDKAKYEILIKGIFKLFFSSPWDLHPSITHESSSNPDRDRRRLIVNRENYGTRHSTVESTITVANTSTSLESGDRPTENSCDLEQTQLYPPGRLLHLSSNNGKVEWRWIGLEHLFDVRLTTMMFTDHMPKKVRKVLRQARDDQFSADYII